jgi:hypothetical protein
MKFTISGVAVLLLTTVAAAQTNPPTDDDLVTLTTPSVLAPGKGIFDLDFRSFIQDDKLFRTGAAVGLGFGGGWEAEIRGDFSDIGTYDTSSGTQIRFGGNDGEALVKVKITGELSVQGGFSYSNTPAQPGRTASVVGASYGYKLNPQLSLYANPRAVILDSNSLVGLGLGASYVCSDAVTLIGEVTPLLAGDNTLSTVDGSRQRVTLYGIALRTTKLVKGVAIDLGYTNSTGQTTGFSLTPGLGNAGAVYLRATSHF